MHKFIDHKRPAPSLMACPASYASSTLLLVAPCGLTILTTSVPQTEDGMQSILRVRTDIKSEHQGQSNIKPRVSRERA